MKNKKSKHQQQQVQPPVQKSIAGISPLGKKIILAGIGLLVVGYFVLTKTDPAGQNLASMISPFLILGGYLAIGAGIIAPEKKQPTTNQQK